jgi:hypothetical protein
MSGMFEISPGKEIYRWMPREPLRLSTQNNLIGLKPYDRALTSAMNFILSRGTRFAEREIALSERCCERAVFRIPFEFSV